MALCCSGDDEDPEGLLEEALTNLQNTLPCQFRTENQENYETAQREIDELEWNNLSPWDRLLPKAERNKILRLNIELHERCPYLQLATGSESYYYCHACANYSDGNKNGPSFSTYPGERGTAEDITRLSSTEISRDCIKNFQDCSSKRICDAQIEND